MKFEGKWMELENILSEVTQTQIDKHEFLDNGPIAMMIFQRPRSNFTQITAGNHRKLDIWRDLMNGYMDLQV
ncbi:hypothetical protein STEG23_019018 [Scotinomys teguina]